MSLEFAIQVAEVVGDGLGGTVESFPCPCESIRSNRVGFFHCLPLDAAHSRHDLRRQPLAIFGIRGNTNHERIITKI